MNSSNSKQTKIGRQGYLPCDNDVIMMTADWYEPDSNIQNDVIVFDGTFPEFPADSRERLSSYADSSTTSVSTPYSVPSFMNIDIFADESAASPPKKTKEHRRNRHVFASCCPKKSKPKSPTKKCESSVQRRRRNKAWNASDFESLMSSKLFK
jgi:hypothetical protein